MWCHRRSWCGLFVGAWMLAALASLSAAERPNIIFVFTDDQASWALGASGNSLAKTPHMDRLA